MKSAKPSQPLAELIHVWTLPFVATLGSNLRAVGLFLEVRAGLPVAARKALTVKSRELTLRTQDGSPTDFANLTARISKALEGIENLPVIPREIEDILSITSTERRRWLADGRLPSVGTRTVHLRGRAKRITFHIFDPRLVEDVLDRGLVDNWREDDALATAERRRSAVWKAKLKRSEQNAEVRQGRKADNLSPLL
ncbi:MAG: hypothetical protein ABIQ30_06630 [Devosia sp.]